MSLHIYIAHTGERLLADPVSFASPDALRAWIARSTPIPAARQILMTARGKNVKLQTLAVESEIFVYDRQYVSDPSTIDDLPDIPIPETFTPQNPPDTLTDQNNLQAWRTLYMGRRTWALNLAEQCSPINDAVHEQNDRTDIIHRAVGVALENLKSHVGSLEHKFDEAQNWANELLKEQRSALDGWQRALTKLESIPASKNFSFLRRPSTPKTEKEQFAGTLQEYVDVQEVKRAGSQASGVSQRFARRMDDVEKTVRDIGSETRALLDDAEPPPLDDASTLLEEVETIAKKVSSDYEHVLGLPNNSKTLSNVSRMALGHTKELLPSLMDITFEIKGALEQAVKQRNSAMRAAISHMQTISAIESRLANAQGQIADLDVDGDVFEVLYGVFQMPVIYGSLLIEAVRRHEWNDKMKADSLSLAEEMALFRDEEQRRRKKWLKGMGDFISLPDDSTPGVEVNLQGHGPDWPEVTRKDVESYIEEIKSNNGMQPVAEELTQYFKDLDAPSRQQRRRAKAFKHGSVFDMGRSSLLVRGDDMVRSLKDEKTKLEDRLKGSDSRIRKLEDLLHRQSQISRPISGHFGPEVPTSPASPRPDQMSRRSSVSSRRMSSNQAPEEKALVQRIVALEAELVAEKETVSRLRKEAHVEQEATTNKMQEVQSTKQDLMGNLEAQQREFDDERKFLESESDKLKIRVEELEEELDKVLDGRDGDKHDAEERIRQLEIELKNTGSNASEQMQRINDQIEVIRGDYTLQKERANNLTEQVQTQSKEVETLRNRNQELERLGMEQKTALQAAHMHLSPEGKAPEDFSSLVRAIEILSEGLAIHARSSDDKAAELSAENKSLEEKLSQLETENEQLKEKRETELTELRDELEQEKSKLSTVKAEQEDERKQLRELRSKFAAGETGSGALRERVAEEERKVATLSEKLAAVDTHAHNSQDELLVWKRKVENLKDTEQRVNSRLEARGSRARHISQKLFTHVERLSRILEQLGFTIVWQDGNMLVQRASKVSSSSALGESAISSGSATLTQDRALLHWMSGDDPDEETRKFDAFTDSLDKFSLDAFGDAVVKRVKDIETLARKWQKEARGYRDKCHRAQSEAHDKIAYRSFKEGDLALFLPTRNQATRSWAAFNVGAPHYFLREQDVHKLQTRDWLLARISKVEERVVDLSKSMNGGNGLNHDRRSIGEVSDGGASIDDDNPFELSDGLHWYLIDASEEKPGAPSTPGLGKSTVASAHVDAKGSIRLKRPTNGGGATKTLTKSLDSRRNSSTSKKGVPGVIPGVPSLQAQESVGDNVQPAEGDEQGRGQRREEDPVFDEVRRDLLLGP
ncbi:oligomeric, coiled-coil, peripheral membrane protein [Arachnomyces sp. PD_36]|nr:oligomeric, coiled-coil, peripheral membrane protein [Arachnomyces sp. PD_36]